MSIARPLAAALLVLLVGAAGAHAELLVAAAASLSDALSEVARAWESSGGEPVALDFAASSTLARQIRQGAPTDVFVSADEAQMDRVENAAVILAGSRRNVLANSLVVIVPDDSPMVLRAAADLASSSVRRLALADPAAVPAGVYARKWLEGRHLWSQVAPKVVPLENVRAALAAVDSGNADAGVVYATDARVAKHSRVAFAVAPSEAPVVLYPAAVVATSKQPGVARRFLDFLASPSAQTVFARYGFVSPP